MLSVAMNERLTQVGPGTPMGELMRRYWHPIAAVPELTRKNPTKPVRLLGEDRRENADKPAIRINQRTTRCSRIDRSVGLHEILDTVKADP